VTTNAVANVAASAEATGNQAVIVVVARVKVVTMVLVVVVTTVRVVRVAIVQVVETVRVAQERDNS
jgi:hypothetical protein